MLTQNNFISILQGNSRSFLQNVALSVVLSLIIAVSAQISIPMWPVPITFQEFAVLSIALMVSPTLAIGATFAYWLEAAIGLPVCQGFGGGMTRILGPVGGYMVGFIAMAAVASTLKTKAQTLPQLTLVCALAMVALYGLGLLWLLNFYTPTQAFALGLAPHALKIPLSIAGAIAGKKLFKAK